MSFLFNVPLLADRSLFRSMGSGFRDKREHFDGGDLVMWFLIVIGVFVVLGVIAQIVARHDKRELYNSPRALFRALCRGHQLDRASRRLLWQMARWQGLVPPARLFLEPERFDASELSPALARHKKAIAALRRKLFAGLETPSGADGAATAAKQ